MRRTGIVLVLISMLGIGATSYAQFEEEDEGLLDLGESTYSLADFGEQYEYDDYGYYSPDYDYTTDAQDYENWYGEADESWLDWSFELF